MFGGLFVTYIVAKAVFFDAFRDMRGVWCTVDVPGRGRVLCRGRFVAILLWRGLEVCLTGWQVQHFESAFCHRCASRILFPMLRFAPS